LAAFAVHPNKDRIFLKGGRGSDGAEEEVLREICSFIQAGRWQERPHPEEGGAERGSSAIKKYHELRITKARYLWSKAYKGWRKNRRGGRKGEDLGAGVLETKREGKI